jgi:peptidyl-prolyl cis-trans isomerase SurA
MRKLVLTCLASGLFVTTGLAQTLFTYGNNAVTKEEFLRVYQKNSINKTPDMSEAALKEYLDLYSLFRMKVREAQLQEVDTVMNIRLELDAYRKQIAKSYLTDEAVTAKLIKEVYDRMKEEVRVAHILVSIPNMQSDSTVAYNKIDSIYKAITTKKADFAATAVLSDDKGSKNSGGDIGYITSMQVVYPFENAAYSTPVGKVSAPFRTQFGYHIVKVLDRRPASGELKVAQIMIAVKKSEGEAGIAAARKRIDSIQADMKKGVPFADLVTKYSDDRFTKDKEGVMPVFGIGKMAPEFEKAAYALKKPGDVSAPVQTDYGFHIIKLIEKITLRPFDSMKAGITKKVNNDSRAQVAREMFFNKIKQDNKFKEYPENYKALADRVALIPDTGKNANVFTAAQFADMNKPLFSLAGTDYLQSDMMTFGEKISNGRIVGPKRPMFADLYKVYMTNIVTDFEEHRLSESQPDFKNLMTEYKDGIMLFELMERNVWGKASKDSVGLEKFYEGRKDRYMWEPGFVGSVFKFKNEEQLKYGLEYIKKGMTDEEILKKMNQQSLQDAVTIQRGHFEFSKFTLVPKEQIIAKKITEPKKNDDGTSYSVVRVVEVHNQPTQKTLNEARGYVVAEYQDYLEKKWNEDMRKKYPVKLNEDVFKSMVKN